MSFLAAAVVFLELISNAASIRAGVIAIAHELDHEGDNSSEDKDENEDEKEFNRT